MNAKDLGSNKEQSVTIEQSSGLNEEEIEKMRKDAELHAEEDKQKQRLAEVRNRSEALCFQTEKLIKENDEKLSDADKAPLEAAIAKAREAAKGERMLTLSNQHTMHLNRLHRHSRRCCMSPKQMEPEVMQRVMNQLVQPQLPMTLLMLSSR